MSKYNTQSGVTLIEVLISLVVIGIGLIAVSQHTGSVIKTTEEDNSHSVSLTAISQLLVPLYISASDTPAAFETQLDLYAVADGFPVTTSDGKATYTVKIAEALDDAGTNVLNSNAPDTWVSPITVGITVSYKGVTDTSGRALGDNDYGVRVAQAPFTFLLQAP